MTHPYSSLPPTAYWRTAVAEPGLFGYSGLWSSRWKLPSDARFSTFGSCFAQHISRALKARQMNWFNAEPPPGRTPAEIARKYNYGVFSARTGNIYTAAQLLLWTRLAVGDAPLDAVEIWRDTDGRFHDTLRPKIEPRGFTDADEARRSLADTARAFRRSFADSEVFIFTLGLTEGWENSATGQVYALCPGTGVGDFDPAVHVFQNYGMTRIITDLNAAFALMRAVNPDLKILLTVSPVPLVATASGDHVLVATTYSKSVLRAVAGEMRQNDDQTDYFPSYEIIASPPTRAAFFEPNMRGIASQGVDLVMSHFFAGLDATGAPVRGGQRAEAAEASRIEEDMAAEELVCEEMLLEKFNEA